MATRSTIHSAEELLQALALRGGAIVHECECGPHEVQYALLSGRGYRNAAGEAFVLRSRRQVLEQLGRAMPAPLELPQVSGEVFVTHGAWS